MGIEIRAAKPDDYLFARQTYYDTMRWLIERLFGWNQEREDAQFAEQFKLEEAEIITVGEQVVGWLQTRHSDKTLRILQIYVVPSMQNKGIGSRILQDLIADARSQGRLIQLSVVKINESAFRLYAALGFQTVGEDRYKYHMELQ
jgi:ribosomal protein S18 acetylase RimI-like enzyme